MGNVDWSVFSESLSKFVWITKAEPPCSWEATISADSALTAMEYSAMPRPWMPHLSMCIESSFDVTRGSNTSFLI